jgi:hypothetical protein
MPEVLPTLLRRKRINSKLLFGRSDYRRFEEAEESPGFAEHDAG